VTQPGAGADPPVHTFYFAASVATVASAGTLDPLSAGPEHRYDEYYGQCRNVIDFSIGRAGTCGAAFHV
jgi:hypothetical protein